MPEIPDRPLRWCLDSIEESYIDAGFNGLDWEAIGDEYLVPSLQTENAWEVYSISRRWSLSWRTLHGVPEPTGAGGSQSR
jgi:hypothetical protein